ncbi:hypothetical protein [Bacillus sp. AFS096315]|uniref:hypothetical protein n=1 Tax=Bacillus sp. AFS096315 TaxID=2033517 RepID=UPI000BEB7405|nr:hypothetical protein [Bacillus sp. AFS096315]PEC50289.1 hypothetical protein CON00_06985 [Bacillus sp. AFS096315]
MDINNHEENWEDRKNAAEIVFENAVKQGLFSDLFPQKTVRRVETHILVKKTLDEVAKVDEILEVDQELLFLQRRVLKIKGDQKPELTFRDKPGTSEWNCLSTMNNYLILVQNENGNIVARAFLKDPKDLKEHVLTEKVPNVGWGRTTNRQDGTPYFYFKFDYLLELAEQGIIKFKIF